MIIIEDIARNVVDKTNARLPERLQSTFHFGTLREIVTNLDQLTRASTGKYPVIALVEPFNQAIDSQGITATLRFLIATFTEKTLKADERLNTNYREVLFPICQVFTSELRAASGSAELKYIQVNHFELGRESLQGYDGTILNDHVDAIELKNIKIFFRETICKVSNI